MGTFSVHVAVDGYESSTYNVHMNKINTTLTTSGNSVAVRLPKELLRMSGLSSKVNLEARRGKIIISKPASPKEGWSAQIKALMLAHGDPTSEFKDIKTTAQDGLDGLPWNGPSFEDWSSTLRPERSHRSDSNEQKHNAKLP